MSSKQWDEAGDLLAIIPPGCAFFFVWSLITTESLKVETDFKTQELTALAWSRSGTLALGV